LDLTLELIVAGVEIATSNHIVHGLGQIGGTVLGQVPATQVVGASRLAATVDGRPLLLQLRVQLGETCVQVLLLLALDCKVSLGWTSDHHREPLL
jgi:hypothetical protein